MLERKANGSPGWSGMGYLAGTIEKNLSLLRYGRVLSEKDRISFFHGIRFIDNVLEGGSAAFPQSQRRPSFRLRATESFLLARNALITLGTNLQTAEELEKYCDEFKQTLTAAQSGETADPDIFERTSQFFRAVLAESLAARSQRKLR